MYNKIKYYSWKKHHYFIFSPYFLYPMKYFEKQTVTQVNNLSKKDIKDFIKKGYTELNPKETYKCHQISNKSKIITNMNKEILFFTYYDKIIDVNFEKVKNENIKRIFLDKGALKAVDRGADVMIPGILKYIDRQDDFKNDEIVYVEIEENGIYGVGIALMSLEEVKLKSEGKTIEILHTKNGCLNDLIK